MSQSSATLKIPAVTPMMGNDFIAVLSAVLEWLPVDEAVLVNDVGKSPSILVRRPPRSPLLFRTR